MLSTIKIPLKLINAINKDIFLVLSKFFNKKIKSQNEIFKFLRLYPNYRSQVFDLLNMLPILHHVNYEMKKVLEAKIFKKNLINWTFPQIRLDDVLSRNFSAPAHKDRWILDKDKIGYVIWIPLKKEGSSLLIGNDDKTLKIKKNSYWGIEAIGPTKFDRKKIKYGDGLLFDADLLHKSDSHKKSRITLQLRYEEIKPKNFRRSVTQKVDERILKYWKRTLT